MKMKSLPKIALAVMIAGVGVSTVSTKAEAATVKPVETTKAVVDLIDSTYKTLSKIVNDTIDQIDRKKEGHRKEDDVLNALVQMRQKYNKEHNAIGSFLYQKQNKGLKLTTTERNQLYNANKNAYNNTLSSLNMLEAKIRKTSARSYGDFGKIKDNMLESIQKDKNAAVRDYEIVKTNIGKAK
ncbi:hypothetical protein bcgnr5390_61240 [Bacillus luti]|nr:hypothetical protein BC2903_60940 [Bacillus cereus]